MKEEVTINEVFDVLVKFANSTERRFDGIDARLDSMDARFDSMDVRLTRVESQMVTKSYLDDKLADLKGYIVQMVDRKIIQACS